LQTTTRLHGVTSRKKESFFLIAATTLRTEPRDLANGPTLRT
jgi:hypothetical protein